MSLDSSAVFLGLFLDVHTSERLHLCYGKDEGRRSSSIFWFPVWYLINKQEQSFAKGVEKPRAGNPGHLIAGDSLVPAGERTCPVPSLQDMALCLLLPSFHQGTGLECPPHAIQVMMVEFMVQCRC